MNIRTTVETDLDQILALLADPSLNTATPQRYVEFLADRSYRHEWTWVAEQDGRIVALAIWWGMPDLDHPLALDGLYADPGLADPAPLWAELVRRTVGSIPPEAEQPEYHIFLPNGWRDQPDVVAALEPRLAAAAAAGLSELTERLRYEWTPANDRPASDLPASDSMVNDRPASDPPASDSMVNDRPVNDSTARSGRLRFEPADDEAFLAVFARVAEGSLDASTQRAVARMGPAGSAQEDLDIYTSMQGDRSWWRLAYDDSGELVGFAIPSANNGGPVVGYLGVLPEHRGRRYSDDLLAEITRQLAAVIERGEARAPRIWADTDLGNQPMAAAFERAGYRNFAVRLVASLPQEPATSG